MYTYFSIPRLAVLVVVKVEPGELLRHQSPPPLDLLVIKILPHHSDSIDLVLNLCSRYKQQSF